MKMGYWLSQNNFSSNLLSFAAFDIDLNLIRSQYLTHLNYIYSEYKKK